MNRRLVASRLWIGCGLLSRRIRRRLAAWIRRGRRTDLTGWTAMLGCIVRAGLLLLAAYIAVRIVRALPAVLWLATPIWCVLAYRAAPAPKDTTAAADEPPATAPLTPPAAFARWLLKTIGDRPGIHLYELYPAMRQLDGHEGLDDTALRAALRTLGVPVTRSLRVGPVEGRSGVRRADAEALLSPRGEQPGETGGDAGQTPDSPALSGRGEWVESA